MKFPPVLVASSAYVFHCSEAAGDAGKAVEVVQDGAAGLQVVGVSCCLVGAVGEQVCVVVIKPLCILSSFLDELPYKGNMCSLQTQVSGDAGPSVP